MQRHSVQRFANLGLRVACLLAGVLVWSCGPGQAPEERPAFMRAMNRGKAHLENRDSALAIVAFEEAVRLAPESPAALRNLARGHLLARDMKTSADVLTRARALEPESVATQYLSGMMFARLSKFALAAPYFEAAIRLDPHTAALRFQLARAYQALERHDEARAQFEETLRLDPLHAAAHYRLAGYARNRGDTQELERRMLELKRLRALSGNESQSAEALEECLYTLAEGPPSTATKTSAPPLAVRFSDRTESWLPSREGGGAKIVTAAVLEVTESGSVILFAAREDGRSELLEFGLDSDHNSGRDSGSGGDVHSRAERTELEVELPPGLLAGGRAVALSASIQSSVANATPSYPAEQARNDVIVVGETGARLLERSGPRSFEDATELAGLARASGSAAALVDFDHDGDLDLVTTGISGLSLWQNGSDGRFEEVAAAVGIEESGPATDVAIGDLDNDVGIDLGVAGAGRPTRIFENQHAGRFAPQPEPPGPWPAARLLRVNDLDNDGHLDALLVGDDHALVIPGGGGPRQRIDLSGRTPIVDAALIDFDNDGRLDILLVSAGTGAETRAEARARARARAETKTTAKKEAGRLALFRNAGAGSWVDVSEATGIDSLAFTRPTRLLVADLDADHDSDIAVVSGSGLRLLSNEGGHVGGQIKIRLVGTKSNPSGIGARVEVRAGGFLAVRSVSALPLEIGLAGHTQIDSLQTVWTNGVVDNEIQPSLSGAPLEFVEKTIAAGSCPYLYALDADGYRFVTDLLGNSPIGLPLSREVLLPADPEELVWVGDSSHFVPRNDHYVLQFTDELREVVYVDEVRLVAVDHPAEVEVHPTDRLMPEPFPPSELWPLRDGRPPRSAMGDDGIDRTAALRHIDGNFAKPGALLPPPLRGLTHPLALTLDFGPLDGLAKPVLALTGWLQYGDASAHIAISQNRDVVVVPPSLEAETPDGRWHPLDVVVGRPAGKTKTIVVDLTDQLPEGSVRLRLRNSFEVRWDRIALFERQPMQSVQRHSASPVLAELRWRGFSDIRQRAPHHPTTPDWKDVSPRAMCGRCCANATRSWRSSAGATHSSFVSPPTPFLRCPMARAAPSSSTRSGGTRTAIRMWSAGRGSGPSRSWPKLEIRGRRDTTRAGCPAMGRPVRRPSEASPHALLASSPPLLCLPCDRARLWRR